MMLEITQCPHCYKLSMSITTKEGKKKCYCCAKIKTDRKIGE
jgi:hypothetical protein